MAQNKVPEVVQAKAKANRERVVVLGNQAYAVQALPMKAAREWRRQFGEPLNVILSVLQNAENIELTSLPDVAALLNQVGNMLLGSVDVLVEALFAYSPALAADRERIEEEADDVEAMAALWEVLQLAYPFGSLVSLLGSLGGSTTGTSKS